MCVHFLFRKMIMINGLFVAYCKCTMCFRDSCNSAITTINPRNCVFRKNVAKDRK